jgi:hypothetical protein
MNGHDLVSRVLAATDDDVGPLIELAGGHETEWLELKAASRPEGGLLPAGQSWGDYTWHVAEALFALANGIGGAVLLGVVETVDRAEGAMPIGLEASGHGGNDDEFIRNLYDQVLSPSNGWSTTKQGRLICTEWHGLFTPIMGRFLGEPVVIILVRPRHSDDGWLALSSRRSKRSEPDRYLVPVRLSGSVGRNRQFKSPEEAGDYWKTRQVERPDLDEDFLRFKAKWDKLSEEPAPGLRNDPAVVAAAIRTCLDSLKRIHAQQVTFFTPVAATGRTQAGDHEPMSTARRSGIMRLLSEEPRAGLAGESGSGKSTCLARIALSRAAGWTPGGSWALPVSLSAYSRRGLRTLLLEPLPGLVWADLEPDIAAGRLTLLLDGLNECPGPLFDRCCRDISGLLKNYPLARVVVASRSADDLRRLGLPTFELAPMEREQQRRFLELRVGSQIKADDLLERLHRQPGADFIAGNPLLLSLVVDAERDGGTLPAGRAALYRQFLEHWYQREGALAGTDGTLIRSPRAQALGALAWLAFRMRARGWRSCDRPFAVQSLAAVVADDADALLVRASQGFLLIEDAHAGSLRFTHETLHDYLVAEHIAAHAESLTSGMLGDAANMRTRAWAMPLVLALELLADPPDDFLRRVWSAEPLLVAAALRDSGRLSSLPVEGDPWTRGILRAMRGDDSAAEAREIALTSHHPPKYPYPTTIINSMTSGSFWYAGHAHPDGMQRIERIERLLVEGGYPWFELLPAACTGRPALIARLNPLQQLLVEPHHGPDRLHALDSATVPELCVLLRLKRISPAELYRRWNSALRRAEPAALEQDLVCLLGTEKWLRGEYSPVRELVRAYGPQLRLIGRNRKLAFRLLSLLVDHKVLSAKEVRSEAGRLTDIIKRTSAMNMFRFLQNGVLTWKDLPAEQGEHLLWQLTPRQLQELELLRLIPSPDAARAVERRGHFGKISKPRHRA